MGRGWKPRPTEAERMAEIGRETSRIINKAMVDQDIRYQMDLADRIGMNRATLSAKLRNGSWTQKDLCALIAALKIPPGEAVRMLGIQRL